MIPKIIHQIWLGDQSKKPVRFMTLCKEMNPSWTYMEWTDSNLPRLINKAQFDTIRTYCGKADILRYELLLRYGGFYIDADSECLRPLDDVLTQNESFACYESEQKMPGLIANGYLASQQNSPLAQLLVDEISKQRPEQMHSKETWQQVGPQFLTNCVNTSKYKSLTIYPSHYFIPVHHSGNMYSGDFKPYFMQHWGTTKKSYGKLGI